MLPEEGKRSRGSVRDLRRPRRLVLTFDFLDGAFLFSSDIAGLLSLVFVLGFFYIFFWSDSEMG